MLMNPVFDFGVIFFSLVRPNGVHALAWIDINQSIHVNAHVHRLAEHHHFCFSSFWSMRCLFIISLKLEVCNDKHKIRFFFQLKYSDAIHAIFPFLVWKESYKSEESEKKHVYVIWRQQPLWRRNHWLFTELKPHILRCVEYQRKSNENYNNIAFDSKVWP